MPAPTFQFRIAEVDARRSTPGTLIECLRFDSDGKKNKYGSIIAFAEIQSSLYLYERFLDTIHAAITQARTLVTGMEGDPMIRFEKIIQKVNEALAAFSAAEATPILWHKIHLYVFQLAEEQLCFSGLGSLTNVFLQQQPNGETKAFDLLGSLEQPEEVDPRKPLASIVCGAMGIGDVLFIGTQNIASVREKIDLVSLCKDHPPVAAAFEIQQRLQGASAFESYYGTLIAGVALTPAKVTKTAAIVTPDPIVLEPEPAALIHEFEQETEEIMEQGSLTSGTSFADVTDAVRQRFGKFRASLKRAPSQKSSSDESLSPISLAGLRSMNSGYARGLVAEKKPYLILLGVLVLALIGGGFWIRSVRAKQAEQKLWMAVYDRSVEAKNRAEAALVYNDEDKARGQYTIALTSFDQLDQSTDDRTKAKADLEKSLNDIRTRLRKEQTVASPAVVADLRENGQTIEAGGLVAQGGSLYSIDHTQNRLRVVRLEDGTVSTINAPEGVTLRLIGTGQTAPLVIGNDRSLFSVKNGALVAFSASSINKASSTSAITTYGRRVYVIDGEAGMIWRSTAGTTSLTGEAAYLTAPSDDIRGASSLAIDSTIYVAAGAKVTKLAAGTRENWGLTQVDPVVKQLTSIWTDVEKNVLAVADPQNKRVLLFRKDGKLVTQYVSPVFQGPTDVWGDAATNTLYVLDSGKIYKLNLPSA